MSDIVWSLNSNNETFSQLQNRMIAFAAMILTSNEILYTFTVDDHARSMQLTGEQRKNIYLIFKEAIHNIVKYADCRNVCINFSVRNNTFEMIIKDDGNGFDVLATTPQTLHVNSQTLGGNGLKNMYARANDINAELCIFSNRKEGTTVKLVKQLIKP